MKYSRNLKNEWNTFETHGFEIRTGPACRTVVIGNRPSFRFFKLSKPEILNFQWTFRPVIKSPGFQNRTRVWRFPKNHKTNIAHNNLQHQIFLEKEKKEKKKYRRLWKQGYKFASGFCICIYICICICICLCFFFICWKMVEGDCCLFENCGRNNRGRERRRLLGKQKE